MRFPDGAIRPAYNAQIAAAPKEGVIVWIEVTDRRNDAGLAGPMVDDIARRYGRTPTDCWSTRATPRARTSSRSPLTPGGRLRSIRSRRAKRRTSSRPRLRGGSESGLKEPFCLKAWRERMASEAGKTVYALRKRIERINAHRKTMALVFFPVHGISSRRRLMRSGMHSRTISPPLTV